MKANNMADTPESACFQHGSQGKISDFLTKRTPFEIKPEENGDRFIFFVEEDEKGIRLDAFLADMFDGLSRSRLKELVKDAFATINDAVETTPNRRLKMGDKISILMPPAADPTPKGEEIPLTITYEDEHLIVIDKPANMVVHPAAGNWSGTLVNALIHHCGESLSGIGGVKRPGIVHRLDKETSGLLVVAKNDVTHQGLSAQFADHGRTGPLRRAYKALAWNEPALAKGTIHTELARSVNNRLKMAVIAAGGREAITHYELIEPFCRDTHQGTALASLVACHLETGRTHQIRVHMAHISCPLIGDSVYGAGFQTKSERLPTAFANAVRKLKRQALHAYLLQFEHPITGEVMRFESDLPKQIEHLITQFRAL